MGLFNKRVRKVSVSGRELIEIMKYAEEQVREEVMADSFCMGSELKVEYEEAVYYIRVDYDIDAAKRDCAVGYDEKYMQYFFNKKDGRNVEEACFESLEQLYDNARVEMQMLKRIQEGLFVTAKMKDVLEEIRRKDA